MDTRLLMGVALLLSGTAALGADDAAPAVWRLNLPDSKLPRRGYPLLEEAEHRLIFETTQAQGVYNHHAHLIHMRNSFAVLWSNHRHGEDGPGQRVLASISEDGRDWGKAIEIFPSMDRVLPAEEKGRVLTANGWLMLEQELYATAEVHDNIGFTTAEAKKVYASRQDADGKAYARARKGLGRLARRVSKDGQLGPIFWLTAEPPTPIGDFTTYPDAADPNFRVVAARLIALQAEPLHYPYWDFRLANKHGFWADAYPQAAADGHGLVEPTTCRRPDGTFLRLFRDRHPSHRLYAAESKDGKSWTVPQATNVPDSPSRSFVGSLPDGRVFLLGNQTAQLTQAQRAFHFPRDPLVISLSADGRAFTWAAAIRASAPALRLPGTGRAPGFQYPHACVVGSDLWIVYSIGKEDIGISRVPTKALAR